MNAALQRLRSEIKFDREALQKRLAELETVALDANASAASGAQAAVALHHAYGAIERILERIARIIDGDLPMGPDWHPALLHTMSLKIDGVRPAVLSRESVAGLRQLLSFRHFFRHAYTVEFDPVRLADLRRVLVETAPQLDAELTAFDTFLAQVGVADRRRPPLISGLRHGAPHPSPSDLKASPRSPAIGRERRRIRQGLRVCRTIGATGDKGLTAKRTR